MTQTISAAARAVRHPISLDRPAVNFFEGAVLGNGGMGVIVCTRGDAVMLHFGHNDIWDIRIAEAHKDELGTFQEIFEKIKALPPTLQRLEDDPWYAAYVQMAQENYRKPYPRPFPCGTLVLGFDRREAELLGHRLDISNGVCTVRFSVGGQDAELDIFCEPVRDCVWLRMRGPAPFDRVHLLPDRATPREFPPAARPDGLASNQLAFRQVLPSQEDCAPHPDDRAFQLGVAVAGRLEKRSRRRWNATIETMAAFEGGWAAPADGGFIACASLDHRAAPPLPIPDRAGWDAAAAARDAAWGEFWGRSAVALDDAVLERTWYHNLYFIACALRPGTTCPGLFANWSLGNIGTAWHGDYHMNYNTQQPFWATFTSNHVDKHLPYVDLVHFLLPVSRSHARDYYGLPGAYFPHSAYPVPMTMLPYPVPTWGWEVCETPWTVQSLWWHYLYTLDEAFLRERAFGPIEAAVEFLAAYLERPEASGPQWGDDKLHIFPTVAPELHDGLRPGFDMNHDCLVDLTLTKFVFNAYLQACRVLGVGQETRLAGRVREILPRLPGYSTAETRYGTVLVSAPGEDPQTVYNTPNPLMVVFPGEEFGLSSLPEWQRILQATYRNQRNEGGNDLVFQNLQGARVGLLDLEKFKRQINYCLLPNGACTDMALSALGRYSDATPFDFMRNMGIWFENFALPAVINECLLQSYDGVLRFFPNWPCERAAEFRTLRAAGAFLVSAACADGAVQWIEVQSGAGAPLRLIAPWPATRCRRGDGSAQVTREPLIQMATATGEVIRFAAA